MKFTVGRKIVFSFGAILALLIIVAGFSFYELNEIEKDSKVIIDDSIPLGQAAANLITDLVNEETGVRGYLATGNDMFLAPYHMGREGIQWGLAEIEPFLDGHPIMKSLIEEAKPKIEAIENYFATQIDLVKSGKLEEAREKANDGKELFDSFRDTHMLILEDVDKLTNDAWNAIKEAQRSARIVISTVSFLALVATLVLTVTLSRSISGPIMKASEVMIKVADGDLTVEKITLHKKDEIGVMITTLNQMVENLKGIVTTVGQNSEQIASMSEQLSSGTDQNMYAIEHITTTMEEIASGANTQSEKVEDTNTLMDVLSTKIQVMSENAKVMSKSSVNASGSAKEGYEQIENAIKQMTTINSTVDHSAKVVENLSDKIRQIGSIVEVITNIADQTNLLALNAAIEAARAGEAGRGFSVVAEEVRVLAEQSATATDNISKIINEIQTDASDAVSQMSKGTTAVNKGTDIVTHAGNSFNQILSSVDVLAKQIQEAVDVIDDIHQNSEKMVVSIGEVSKIAQTTSSGTQTALSSIEEQSASMEEITAASNTLASMAEELQSVVSQFKI